MKDRVWTTTHAVRAGTMAVAALLAAGCTYEFGGTAPPQPPQEQWTVDREECDRLAREKAERDFAREVPADVGENFGRTSTLRTSLGRFDADRHRERLFERCLVERSASAKKTEAVTPEVKEE